MRPSTPIWNDDRCPNARELDFVPCSDIFIDTLKAFRTHAVQGLSFADTAIVTVACRFEPPMIATFDRGFTRIEGLEITPASSRSTRGEAGIDVPSRARVEQGD